MENLRDKIVFIMAIFNVFMLGFYIGRFIR